MKINLDPTRTITRLRKKFPQHQWKYNSRSQRWECAAGYAVLVLSGDEDGEYYRLCFYPTEGAPIWVR